MIFKYTKNIEAIKGAIEQYTNIPNSKATISIPDLKLKEHEAKFEIEKDRSSIKAKFEMPEEVTKALINAGAKVHKLKCTITTQSNEYYSDECFITDFNDPQYTLLVSNLKTLKKEPEKTKYVAVCYFKKAVQIRFFINGSYYWKSENSYNYFSLISIKIKSKEFHIYPILCLKQII